MRMQKSSNVRVSAAHGRARFSAMLFFGIALVDAAHANIVVSYDGSPSASTCTLAQAINAANAANGVAPASYGSATPAGNCAGAAAGSNTIDIAIASITATSIDNHWYGPNAMPPIASEIVIDGSNGHGVTLRAIHTGDPTPATANAFRFFYVSAGFAGELPVGKLTLEAIALQGGYAKGGDSAGGGGGAGMGGAIFNQGTLILEAVTLIGNTAQGGNWNGNAGDSGGGMGQDSNYDLGVGGGFGGALGGSYGGNGGNGGNSSSGSGSGGGGGFLTGSDGGNAVSASGASGGGNAHLGGAGALWQSPGGTAGDGGGGGSGSTIFDGSASGGRFGAGGFCARYGGGGGGGGVGGGGGCAYADGGGGGGGFGGGGGYEAAINIGNDTTGSVGGFGGGAADGATTLPGFGGGYDFLAYAYFLSSTGGSGMGGAIFNHRGTVSLLNVTATNNKASGGACYDASVCGGTGTGSGLGAVLFNLNGVVTIDFSTLAGNTLAGNNGLDDTGGPEDGAVYSLAYGDRVGDGGKNAPSLTIHNSIVRGTYADDGGHNDVSVNLVNGAQANSSILTYTGTNFVGQAYAVAGVTQTGAASAADPLLGASSVYRSSAHRLPIFPIGASSPAIDAAGTTAEDTCLEADASTTLPDDERGAARPYGLRCDVGAYEYDGDYIFAANNEPTF